MTSYSHGMRFPVVASHRSCTYESKNEYDKGVKIFQMLMCTALYVGHTMFLLLSCVRTADTLCLDIC
jgi:hypothetical protein